VIVEAAIKRNSQPKSHTLLCYFLYLGRAHNPEVAGSNPVTATMKTHLIDGFFVYERYNYNLSSCP